MKKLLIVVACTFALAACHYGQDEAKETLERNELYKGDKADYSINRAGEYGTKAESGKSVAIDTLAVDTTKK
ncbi:MAG: hypothetical protein MUC81_10460 [Bacteroidia bacterium]|jgi:hypothetical protein|nr:hypothetical protein [Bacteroidia bacterium]